MEDWKKSQKGSERRDEFKLRHKQLHRSFYLCDLDFVWVEKSPPGIAAFLDYKDYRDEVTFAEVLAYNVQMGIAPVYIVTGPSAGPFRVEEYKGGDWRPDRPVVVLEPLLDNVTWEELGRFEFEVRFAYRNGTRWRCPVRDEL